MVRQIHYDPEADILYIVIKEGSVENTIDVDEDVFIELDGNVVGIEIWDASRNVIKRIAETLVSKIKQQLNN